jgi:hypothetical protein
LIAYLFCTHRVLFSDLPPLRLLHRLPVVAISGETGFGLENTRSTDPAAAYTPLHHQQSPRGSIWHSDFNVISVVYTCTVRSYGAASLHPAWFFKSEMFTADSYCCRYERVSLAVYSTVKYYLKMVLAFRLSLQSCNELFNSALV